jgi:hypothetical protein
MKQYPPIRKIANQDDLQFSMSACCRNQAIQAITNVKIQMTNQIQIPNFQKNQTTCSLPLEGACSLQGVGSVVLAFGL